MPNKVKLKKSQIDYFRRLSRNNPNEIQGFLIGEVVSPVLTVIDSIEYPPSYYISTPHKVQCYAVDIENIQRKAEERGKRVVGFIHNHPEWDAVMSPGDYDVMIHYGYRVCGIVSTQGNKTRPRFWNIDTALPCIIEYVKKKPKSE